MKKKLSKVFATVLVVALAVATSLMFVACGGATEYTTTFDNLESWDYSFVSINAFGDEAGVGMINLNSWGNKKLKLGADGTCAGEGCSWTCKLVMDGDNYELSLIAHLVGAGADYSGEGDFTYMFQGTGTKVDDGYKLAKPTYVKVSLTGDFRCTGDKTDFANYIPDAPYSLDSNGEGQPDATNKVVADKLIDTVFRGATFHVSGNSIVSVDEVVWS